MVSPRSPERGARLTMAVAGPYDGVFDSTIDGTNCGEELLCDSPSQFKATLG